MGCSSFEWYILKWCYQPGPGVGSHYEATMNTQLSEASTYKEQTLETMSQVIYSISKFKLALLRRSKRECESMQLCTLWFSIESFKSCFALCDSALSLPRAVLSSVIQHWVFQELLCVLWFSIEFSKSCFALCDSALSLPRVALRSVI